MKKQNKKKDSKENKGKDSKKDKKQKNKNKKSRKEKRKEKKQMIFPKNKKHLDKLIPLAQRIIITCREAGTDPVVYGSFAHFIHTKDKNMKINDIDLLVKISDLPKIKELLDKRGMESRYFKEYNTIIVRIGKLRVEIDGVGFDYETITEDSIFSDMFQKTDLAGVEVRTITLEQLEDIYSVAYRRTKDDKKKILKKIKMLERSLGRQIKNSPTKPKDFKKTFGGNVLNYFNKRGENKTKKRHSRIT